MATNILQKGKLKDKEYLERVLTFFTGKVEELQLEDDYKAVVRDRAGELLVEMSYTVLMERFCLYHANGLCALSSKETRSCDHGPDNCCKHLSIPRVIHAVYQYSCPACSSLVVMSVAALARSSFQPFKPDGTCPECGERMSLKRRKNIHEHGDMIGCMKEVENYLMFDGEEPCVYGSVGLYGEYLGFTMLGKACEKVARDRREANLLFLLFIYDLGTNELDEPFNPVQIIEEMYIDGWHDEFFSDS